MMGKFDAFKSHMQRLRAGANQAQALSEVSRWIAENTYLGGNPFSFSGHEYQERILNDTSRDIVIRKCSQVGISELAVRRSLALCGMIRNFTCIYTLPTAHFAATLMKTRVNPVIQSSPYLRELVSDIDNVEVKQIGGSFLYLKGSASGNAPISIPCDCLVHDERDFSDPLILSQYTSRLSHSKHKMRFNLSTPTLPGKGIDHDFSRSRRHFMFVKCSCCGHHFVPSYYDHVRIPGFNGELLDISKRNLHTTKFTEAFVECPNCGGKPSLLPDYREWVLENPDDNHVAAGFQVSPFDAPTIVSPAYLVEASTNYSAQADFVNFALGLPFFSSEAVLAPEEIRACITRERFVGGAHVMGVDLGKTCHIVVASVSWDGALQIVHTEEVMLQKLRERYTDLRIKYRVRSAVIDSLPYTDTVLALQAIDQNLWASVYTQSRGVDLFTVKQRDEDAESGIQQLRQINVARDRTFDALMAFIRSGQFSKFSDDNDDIFVAHCTDMRRVKDWNPVRSEMAFKWVKSEDGEDHFWFALSYAFLAKHILGTSVGNSASLPLLSTFKLKMAKS